MKYYLGMLIIALVWTAGSSMANRAQAYGSPVTPLHNERRHVAVMGNSSDIDKAVKGLIEARQLRLLRNYPEPAAYLEEGGFPAAAALRVYEVMTGTVAASEIVSKVLQLEQDHPVQVEAKDLAWVTYVPDEAVVSGNCEEITEVSDAIQDKNSDLNLKELDNVPLDYPGLAASELTSFCIRFFSFATSARVADVVAQFNEFGHTVLAEPNYIATGAQYIAGSPGGPQKPAQTLLKLSSPLTTTGQGVSIYAFDSTAPYTLTAPVTRTVEVSTTGISVTLHAFVPLPPNLPDAPAAPGHGTFVLSPMLQLAPDAEIHLVRTLNVANYGDTWTLIHSLDQVLWSLPAGGKTIFNYSFGLAGPNQPSLDNAIVRLLDVINDLGIPQIGAAGNDSAYTSQPLRDVLPARHPDVISVGAVTKNGEPACYSNRGEISALGGGIPRTKNHACDTDQIVANCNAGNEVCVSGWAPRPQGSIYSWGVGTSFATPIITAIAAQAAEELAASGGIVTPQLIRQRLQDLVNKGCDLSTGIGCPP